VLRIGRLVVAVVWRFQADHGLMRASSLAYTSLLSLVPLLAVMFAVLKGLGVQRRLEPILLSRLALQPETTQAIIEYIDRTSFHTLGVFGGIALLLTIYSLLGNIESSFNFIWRVRQGRTFWQEVGHYSAVVLLTPFLLLGAVALTSSLQVVQLASWARERQLLGDAMVIGLGLVPPLMNVLALAVLYAVMPNRRAYWPSVLLGAIVAGIGWHLVQVAYLQLQFGMARYNAIYGALSQLPITLVWQYVSWVIVLAGAELAAVFEFGEMAQREEGERDRSAALAIELLVRAARAFGGSGPGVSLRDVARTLRVPYLQVYDAAQWLVSKRWIAALADSEDRYVLVLAPERIHLGDLVELAGVGMAPLPGCVQTDQIVGRLLAAQRGAWDRSTLADMLVARGATSDVESLS